MQLRFSLLLLVPLLQAETGRVVSIAPGRETVQTGPSKLEGEVDQLGNIELRQSRGSRLPVRVVVLVVEVPGSHTLYTLRASGLLPTRGLMELSPGQQVEVERRGGQLYLLQTLKGKPKWRRFQVVKMESLPE